MIPLAVPDLTGNEKKYLDDCIDTTFVSSVGEYVDRFELEVATATGSNYAVATSSGTTGIHAALTAVGVKRDELVIVPSFTFIATANAVRHCGSDPWLMDVSNENWCLNPDILREQIELNCKRTEQGLFHVDTGKRVAAIMPVYTLGNMPDMREFRDIADKYNVPLVVDAACAIGATYDDKPFGELADLSVISFNGNKTVTCGGGGAVVGNNQELLLHVRHLTKTARVWPEYDFDEVGFNYRMTNLQAAVGCAQMERLDEFVDKKREIRKFYINELESLGKKDISFFPTTPGSSCWFSGIVLSNNYETSATKEVCNELVEFGVDARPFWKPIHLQRPYFGCPLSETAVTDNLWYRIITLPCSTSITEDELKRVVNTLLEVLGS